VHEIKGVMQRSNELGMKTFDQSLFQLYEADLITYDDALRNADSVNELRLRIKLEGKAAKAADKLGSLEGMGLVEEDNARVMVR
jgi:twitching motility protein PilU